MNFSPTYLPITQNNYTKNTDVAFPDIDWRGSLYVVSSFSASDGAGGTYNQAFWYYGAHLNLQGRGFDGFYAKQTTDNRNGIIEHDYYQRSFPYVGMTFQRDVSQPSFTLMSRVINTLTKTTLESTTNNQRYFPYVSQSVETDNEVGGVDNGSLINQITKTYVFDTYGNATSVTTATVDEDSGSAWHAQTWTTVVTQAITPNTADWCLTVPTQITVQKTLPSTTSVTRTTSVTPDYVNCRVSSTVNEPASSTLKVTKN